jgi:hypothetical protein
MKMQFYVSTKEISENNYLYGVMSMINDEPFDFIVGQMNGEKDDIINLISKNTLIKNKTVLKNNYYTFKYEDLDTTKKMLSKFHTDDFYKSYSKEQQTDLDALPALFLSDTTKMMPLNKKMNNYKQMIQYYQITKEKNRK